MRFVGGAINLARAKTSFDACMAANKHSNFSRCTWKIVQRENNSVVGICALVANRDEAADIGLILVAASHGKGIAKEILSRLIDYAFKELGLTKVAGYSVMENTISYRLMSSLGFKSTVRLSDTICGYDWSLGVKQWEQLTLSPSRMPAINE
jgi:RimJ/RimL family protein N-acetyltransferase